MADAQRIVDALLAAGWDEVGRRQGIYVRLARPRDVAERRSLLVPLNPAAGEYDDLMSAVLRTLETAMFEGKAAHLALNRIDPETYR